MTSYTPMKSKLEIGTIFYEIEALNLSLPKNTVFLYEKSRKKDLIKKHPLLLQRGAFFINPSAPFPQEGVKQRV